ncbi:hypothetical protein [Methanoculleus horonobensis]|jgi:hypothetical protein|uniref:hypothetical protein n=1 Tax=Methanoculleus horonobensis TaxID=528314 RepID=UPI000834DD22|nr:hypothetical protein [Methanoculleus horonobensis]MDD3070000.1 hypothetical protein [Methanoculleus horonobensis]MDD4252565.1 hypothetical protein [Methanoculleus horonobensis]
MHPPEDEREVTAMMVEGRRTNRVVLNRQGLDEQQTMARGIIVRMIVRFHREWDELRERESGSARVLASNAMLEQCSHQLYNCACDMRAVLGEELAGELRCLSAEIIKTANILIMLGCGEERRKESEIFAQEALLRIERCLALVQKEKGYPATRISVAYREE